MAGPSYHISNSSLFMDVGYALIKDVVFLFSFIRFFFRPKIYLTILWTRFVPFRLIEHIFFSSCSIRGMDSDIITGDDRVSQYWFLCGKITYPGCITIHALQTFLVWQLLLSFLFLGRRYCANQVLGCILVSLGVIITVARYVIPLPHLIKFDFFFTSFHCL